MSDNCLHRVNEWETISAFYDSVTLALCTYKQPFYIVLQGWWHCLASIGGNNYQKGLVIGLIVIRSTLHWLALAHLRTSQKVTRPKPFLTWVNNDEVMVQTPNPKNNLEHRDQVQWLGWIWLLWGKALFPPTAHLPKVFGNISGWFMLQAAKLARAGSRQVDRGKSWLCNKI